MGETLKIQYNNSELLNAELALWQEFTEGSEEAYESIYQKYVKELYSYAYMVVGDKNLAEDAIHDVFTDLWSNRKNLSKIRSIRLYLFSSIKRRSLRKLKKERSYTYFDKVEEGETFEIVPSFLDELIDVQHKDSLTKKIMKCLEGLSNRQREIIYLRFYQDLSYAEIAQLLELDQKYTYNLASKAFCILRKTMPGFLVISVFFILNAFGF